MKNKQKRTRADHERFFFLVYAGSGSGQSVLIWADPEHRES